VTEKHDEFPQARDPMPSALPTALLPFPVFGLDAEHRITASNGVLERALGIGEDAFLRRGLSEIVDRESQTAVEALIRSGSRRGMSGRALLTFTSGRGSLTLAVRVLTEGDKSWLVGEPSDTHARITELEQSTQRAELQADEYARLTSQLKQANEELERRAQQIADATTTRGRFLGMMSHELRTPPNAILGYAGLLRDSVYGDVSPTQVRAVHSIIRRAKDLQVLIDDVLDLARLETGRTELHDDEFDPSAVLAEVRDGLTPLSREKELNFVVRYKLRRSVRLDRGKYKQVLAHLVSNAVKFTPPGGEIELAVEPASDDEFVTRVSDTGIGMTDDELRQVFESFEQVDAGTTRRFSGIGLGLAMVRRLVELMGGHIDVDSKPGVGTNFIITLPIHSDRDEPAVIEAPPEVPGVGDPIVLAIDDDPEVIGLLRDSLAPAHYRVVGALSGDRGLELARITKPFAITLDIMMPEKDGWQVLRELKADPELRDIPVVVMSIVSERDLGFSLGVTEYLVKPVDRHDLLDVLDRVRHQQLPHSALVVDDDPDARVVMCDLLESLDFEVRTAATCASALEQLAVRAPDVLFLDVTMPDHDAAELLDRVARDKQLEHMRTVVVTHGGDPHENQMLIRRAAAAVTFDARHREETLRDLRKVLASIGAAASGGA
jgi:signal transduction histidine kinase/CheY-like chemotaxis protein